jgi:hypothetical protein
MFDFSGGNLIRNSLIHVTTRSKQCIGPVVPADVDARNIVHHNSKINETVCLLCFLDITSKFITFQTTPNI